MRPKKAWKSWKKNLRPRNEPSHGTHSPRLTVAPFIPFSGRLIPLASHGFSRK